MVSAGLRNPETLLLLDLSGWDLLVRQARQAGLLARLCICLEEHDLLDSMPDAPRAHLESELTLTRKHARDVRWEVECIGQALAELDAPVTLLKGAAYTMTDLPAARGRLFSDIDIMVAKDTIASAEKALRGKGWITVKQNAYDQQYYRRWMHEIPPMHNIFRGTTLDVHHTIVPETARSEVNAGKLMEAALPLDGHAGLCVLAPRDMVLHSAVHLFNEGEFVHGLRDLSDLDLLMRHFASTEPNFWNDLVERAAEFGLERPLYYALRFTARILGTPVPEKVIGAAAGAPGPVTGWIMDFLFSRALRPDHATCRAPFTGLALWLLYVRAHHLRMPPHLLVPHLIRKAVSRRLEG
jgi:hypothetical protein